ncbi:MAG: heparinase II/III family protein, partial [Candidatus Hydrogenedentes bacterium]|nr:heparinase II/III family protein [Candidatus Hydrogenedentota bacterium]
FALAAWLEPNKADFEHLCALIESVLDEPTWVLPAHERPVPWNIDLFSAETACELAHVLLLVEERLPDDLVQRMRSEVRTRVMAPYLEHAHEYWWDGGRNNWTGVCAGSVGQTFLLLEPDTARQAQAVTLVLGQMHRFLEKGFEEDGACLEGIGYWSYGLLHFVSFGEMLREKTGGAVDLLAHPKLKAIAQYPATVAIDKHAFAAFADSHEHQSLTPFLAARLAERTGIESLLPQASGMFQWRLTAVLRNVLWWDGPVVKNPVIEDAFLPAAGIVKLVRNVHGKRVVLAAKAGHNAEPHNNNDVGSFVLRIGNATYLCDPGAGLYSREYFSSKRYENIFANSYGHSVPRIGGALQPPGAQYRGELSLPEPKTARIDLTKAYSVEGLKEAIRLLTLQQDGTLVMETQYAFDGAGLEVEEAFITWLDVETDGATARLISSEGVVEIHADGGVFAAERLEEACKANRKSDVLTRITLTHAAAPEIHNRYTFAHIAAE